MKVSFSNSPLAETTRFRVQIKHAVAIGPGKASVLQGIEETGSIAEAGRRLGMSYQRVWSLVRALNNDFVEPLVLKQRGGASGGSAQLTATGQQVLRVYRAIERDAQRAVMKRLPELAALLKQQDADVDARAEGQTAIRCHGACETPSSPPEQIPDKE